MKLSRRSLVVLGAAAVAGALAAWRLLAPAAIDAVAVARGDIVQTVVVSGRVESPKRVNIGSQVTGIVAEVAVEEGQSVHAGQLLVRLDDSEARAAVEQARYAVTQAEARIAQLRVTSAPVAQQALRQAETSLDNAERALQRNRELFARGFIGQAALDDAQKARDVAESQWQGAKVQAASARPGGSDHVLAEVALAQAQAALKAARAHLEFMTVEAPVDGVLISRNVERGNVAQPGTVLMVLSPAGSTQLVVPVDEKNLNVLRVGQAALASADAYPNDRFEARVAYINPGVDASRGAVEVKLDVPKPPAYLLQDMTVSVDIEVARKKAVLTLPAEAVHDAASGKPWVLAVKDGRAVRRDIALGARGDLMVEVAGGLAEGDLAIPATQGAIQAGTPVRVAARAKRNGRPS
jgi:HlyD family secretion protein